MMLLLHLKCRKNCWWIFLSVCLPAIHDGDAHKMHTFYHLPFSFQLGTAIDFVCVFVSRQYALHIYLLRCICYGSLNVARYAMFWQLALKTYTQATSLKLRCFWVKWKMQFNEPMSAGTHIPIWLWRFVHLKWKKISFEMKSEMLIKFQLIYEQVSFVCDIFGAHGHDINGKCS